MPEAIRLIELPHMTTSVDAAKTKKKARGRRGQVVSDLSGKTWSELTPPEKDTVLEALALAAGLVQPEP